jgi:hypothetical protein
MFKCELTFAVIAFILVVPTTVLLSVASSASDVSAVKKISVPGMKCTVNVAKKTETCCWEGYVNILSPNPTVETLCQTCRFNPATSMYNLDCGSPEIQYRGLPTGDLPQLETVPPNRTLSDLPTDLPTLEQVPPPRTLPGGGGDIPTLQQQQGEPPLPVVCSKEAGLVKDPETGQCVPIVQPPPSPPRVEDAEQPTEEPEEQPDQDDEQSSEGDDSSEGNNNGNSDRNN